MEKVQWRMYLLSRGECLLLAIRCAEGAELDRRLCADDLGCPVGRHVSASRLLRLQLLLDPEVCDPQPILQAEFGSSLMSDDHLIWVAKQNRKLFKAMGGYLQLHGWSPAKLLLDERVVGVAATDTLWAGDVVDGQLLVLEAEDYLSHLVHAHHFVASDVHRLTEIRLR